jgi:hypothetical protein
MADMTLRQLAATYDLPEAVSCDRCGQRPAEGRLSLAGSAAWILKECDEHGVRVDRREALEVITITEASADDMMLSQRVILLCKECSQAISWPLDHVCIEAGYEEAFERVWAKLENEAD